MPDRAKLIEDAAVRLLGNRLGQPLDPFGNRSICPGDIDILRAALSTPEPEPAAGFDDLVEAAMGEFCGSETSLRDIMHSLAQQVAARCKPEPAESDREMVESIGIAFGLDDGWDSPIRRDFLMWIFAQIRADEREACAKTAAFHRDLQKARMGDTDELEEHIILNLLTTVVDEIRNRSEGGV